MSRGRTENRSTLFLAALRLAVMGSEANLVEAYRKARKAFIAGCGGDSISRVHPKPGPDRKPLFCDSAAFGPRDAARALLVIGGIPDAGMIKALPKGARLVLVHALDPYVRAFGRAGKPADWPQKTLAAIASEDLGKVKTLTVLDLEGGLSGGAGSRPAPGKNQL